MLWPFSSKKKTKRDKNPFILDNNLKKAFKRVKNEFNDHLEAINENTNEIQSNYELLLKLDSKLDKLESKFNEMELFLRQFKSQQVYFLDDKEKESFVIEPLTEREKKVFRAIYELDAEHRKITYQTIAEVLGSSLSLSRDHITTLIEKGVPITKSYLNGKIFLSLEPKFRELQTKSNIISI